MTSRRQWAVPAETDVAVKIEDWPDWMRAELADSHRNGCVGRQILAENARARVWRGCLKPRERIAFHSHVLDHFWIALGDGSLRSRDASGRVDRYDVADGAVFFRRVPRDEPCVRDLENVGSTTLCFMVVEFIDSANAPLPVPDHVRVK